MTSQKKVCVGGYLSVCSSELRSPLMFPNTAHPTQAPAIQARSQMWIPLDYFDFLKSAVLSLSWVIDNQLLKTKSLKGRMRQGTFGSSKARERRLNCDQSSKPEDMCRPSILWPNSLRLPQLSCYF